MVTVSICIPAYNNEPSLKRLLESIKQQSFTDYELIITDDSTDEKVGKLVGKYPELSIKYYKNENSLGPTANTNMAVSKAVGKYIKIMHHDDAFSGPDSLKKMAAMLEDNPHAVLAFCGTNENTYDAEGNLINEKSFTRVISDWERSLLEHDYRNLFLVNMIGAPSAVIFKNEGMYLDEELRWLVDIDFYIRLLQKNFHYIDCPEPLINIGLSETQVTRSCIEDEDLILKETKYVFEKYGLIEEWAYRRYLIRMVLKMNRNYSELKGCGVKRREYFDQKLRKIIKDILKK